RRTVALAPAPAGIEKDGPHADRPRAENVDRVEIADVDRIVRLDARAPEGHPEDPWIRFLDADDERVEHEVEVWQEAERVEQRGDGAVRVGDDARGQAGVTRRDERACGRGLRQAEKADRWIEAGSPLRHRAQGRVVRDAHALEHILEI